MAEFYQLLSDQQKIFFNHYKSNDAYINADFFATTLNERLRDGALKENWQPVVEMLDEIININRLTREQTVYRVTSLEIINKFRTNDRINYPAYLSTGEDVPSIQTHFKTLNTWDTPLLLEILCPTGTAAAPLESDSTSEMEKEMLLGRNHVFIIEKKMFCRTVS